MKTALKNVKVYIGILLVIGLVVLAFKIFIGNKHITPAVPPRPVKTELAVQKDVPVYIESFGNLCPSNDVNIKAQVTGEIKEVSFTEGQNVKTGDRLFTIDESIYKVDLQKAQAALAQDIADLELKKSILERNQKLFDSQLVSQQDFDKIKADVTTAEEKIKLDKAGIDLAQINLKYCSITSPIDGVTGKRQVDLGNIVTANTGPTLVNIKTIDPLYVDFTVPETNLQKVRSAKDQGQLKVQVYLQNDPSTLYPGELELISNAVDNTTGTISLRAIAHNKERKLWAGQFVRVRLILGVLSNAVLVPYESVQLGQQGNFLFVVTPDNKADLRAVATGQQYEDAVVIVGGVKSGERVVTSGQMGLSPGVSVIEGK